MFDEVIISIRSIAIIFVYVLCFAWKVLEWLKTENYSRTTIAFVYSLIQWWVEAERRQGPDGSVRNKWLVFQYWYNLCSNTFELCMLKLTKSCQCSIFRFRLTFCVSHHNQNPTLKYECLYANNFRISICLFDYYSLPSRFESLTSKTRETAGLLATLELL